MAGLLLDTCACIWLMGGEKFSEESRDALQRAATSGEPLSVSPITAWEVAINVAHRKLNLAMPVRNWFERLLGNQGISLSEFSPAILVESTELPAGLNNDPADRIIAATARHFGLVVVTRDEPLLRYSQMGHLQAVRC